MPFIPSDTYCSGGPLQLTDYWLPTVWKHDTSSFYNWEEDNEPIYDLEDRTNYLWEKGGYPTSGLQNLGAVFVVSGAAHGIPPNHKNTFATLSGAIEALPDVIRYPIQIEVVKYGELEELNLKNLKFAKTGCLEIVNRLFTKAKGHNVNSDDHSIAKSVVSGGPRLVSGIDLYNEKGDASAYSLSTNVYDDTEFYNSGIACFSKSPFEDGTGRPDRLAVSNDLVKSAERILLATPNASELLLAKDLTAPSYDISSLRQIDDIYIYRAVQPIDSPGNKVAGCVYANQLSKIKVENCNGPIYLRNFIVDGASGVSGTLEHVTELGVEINNSNVMLDNLTVLRCKDAGLEANNAKVVLNRGFISYRNYEVSNTYRNTVKQSPGLRANNSTVVFDNIAPVSGTSDTRFGKGRDALFMLADNHVGIEANNSKITFGNLRPTSHIMNSAAELANLDWLLISRNRVGIVLNDSNLDIKGRLDNYNNLTGIKAVSSKINIQEALFENNQDYGIHLLNSNCTYNDHLYPLSGAGEDNNGTQLSFWKNGQHLKLEDNSSFKPTIAYENFDNTISGMPNLYGNLQFLASHGVTKDVNETRQKPAIEVTNNSYADLVHAFIDVSSADYFEGDTSPTYGLAAAVTNNSVLKFRGSKNGTTVCVGPTGWLEQEKVAGIYANNNSTVSFHGPTILAQYGVDVLAENNSTVDFSPQKDDENNYDIKTWQLSDPGNHTSVELHSTRACLVVDKNSILNMNDLGDYSVRWDVANPAVSALMVSADYVTSSTGLDEACSGGYVQFYPNPRLTNPSANTTYISNNTNHTVSIPDYNEATLLANGPIGNDIDAHKAISHGGICVRALRGSGVKVKNVHFPTGWENASAAIYDVSSDCNKTYIWNIDPTSQLNAAYCSVSGYWPTSSVYHGPYSVHTTTGGNALTGAPGSTPNTGTLSVLDSFGLSAGDYAGYGKDTFDNRGPFRLYFSPKDPAKWLGYPAGSEIEHGTPYQLWAQGYNPSGDVSSTASGPASDWSSTGEVYRELHPEFKEVSGTGSDASSFFYTSSFLDPGYVHRIRLDDSAINIFANAKNATIGESGRPKLVTYYRAIVSPQGASWDADSVGHGLGFRSASEFDLDRKN